MFVGFVFQVLVLDFVLQVADVFFGLILVTFAVLFLRLRLLRVQELLRKLFSYCENTTDADSGSDSIAEIQTNECQLDLNFFLSFSWT